MLQQPLVPVMILALSFHGASSLGIHGSRRDFLSGSAAAASMVFPLATQVQAVDSTPNSLPELLPLVKEARVQLDAVPGLINAEKWDSVRAILIKPPLSDCWAKTSRPLLSNYAQAVGDAGGDELGVLEAKEEAVSHLRYLDMAVYSNVFNPIKSEGESGATRGLIRSYYEDPINEYKAATKALDELVKLGSI